jgi:hypothetical protein
MPFVFPEIFIERREGRHGQWLMGNGQWAMVNGQWLMGNG